MASRLHRFFILILATVAAGSAVRVNAQTIPLPVTVNRVAAGDRVVNILADDVTIRRTDLEQLGLGGTMWDRLITFGRMRQAPEPIEGSDAVSLKSLAPLLTYVLDQNNLTLDLTVQPALFKPHVVETRVPRPTDLVYSRDNTAFLNYAFTSPSLHNFTFFGEAGATIGSGLLYSAFSRSTSGRLIRGLTNFTYDDVPRLRRWTVGDAVITAPEALGGSAIMTGVTVSRNFGLDPYFLRFPAMDLAGTAATPSQVDVYVNGVLVGRHDVAPGPFSLRDVPVAAGAGTTQIVIRDAFGRQTTASTNYYYSTNLLNRGLSEYLYSAGVIRERFGITSFSAGDPAAIAFHRIGISDSLTVGGRAEASRQLFSGGPVVDFQSPIGEWRVGAAASTDHGTTGAAGELGYRYIARRFGFGATARKYSDDYATLSSPAVSNHPLLDATIFGSVSNRFGSLTAQWNKLTLRDGGDLARATLGLSVPIASRGALIGSVTAVDENGKRHNEYFAGASFTLGFTTSASVSFGSSGDGHQATIAEVQRSLPIGTGYGYRLQTQVDEAGHRIDLGAVQYQTEFGRYEIAKDVAGQDRPTISASGAIVYADRTIHFAQPIQESYALVQIPGVDNVRVYSSNQLVGRTDSHGNILVPKLLAYYGNPLHIEDKDVPMTYEVGEIEKTVAPPYRGGAIVVFPVKQHRSITGSLSVASGGTSQRPGLGTLTISGTGQKWDSPIGRAGEFYLEDVPAGTYDAVVEWTGGTCAFRLTLPAGTGDVVKLGDVVCSQ